MDSELAELIELLEQVEEDVDFEGEEALVDDHILDSFDILQIISLLNETYDISIPAKDIVPENFNSAAAILELVTRIQEDE